MRQCWQGSKRYNKYAKHSPSWKRDIRQHRGCWNSSKRRPNIQFPTPLSYPSCSSFDQNGIICFDAENKRCTLWCVRRVQFSTHSHRLTSRYFGERGGTSIKHSVIACLALTQIWRQGVELWLQDASLVAAAAPENPRWPSGIHFTERLVPCTFILW